MSQWRHLCQTDRATEARPTLLITSWPSAKHATHNCISPRYTVYMYFTATILLSFHSFLLSKSVKGLRRCGGSKMVLHHYFGQWLIQQLVLPYKPWLLLLPHYTLYAWAETYMWVFSPSWCSTSPCTSNVVTWLLWLQTKASWITCEIFLQLKHVADILY